MQGASLMTNEETREHLALLLSLSLFTIFTKMNNHNRTCRTYKYIDTLGSAKIVIDLDRDWPCVRSWQCPLAQVRDTTGSRFRCTLSTIQRCPLYRESLYI